MSHQKLFKNRNDGSSSVYMSMKNIEANVEQNGDSVIIIDNQVHTTNSQNKPAINNKLSLKSSGTEYIAPPYVESKVENIDNDIITLRRNNHRLVEGSVQKQTSLDSSFITQEHIEPIVTYVEEPLLSLTEACASLTSIIPDLSKYVQLALNATPQKPPDDLTVDESAAIRLYTIEWEEPHASLYSKLNSTLKKSDRETLRPFFKYLKLLLTALVKLPCAPLQTVWRGVNKDFSKDFPPGTAVTWWAFSSCTTSLTVLENNIYLSTIGQRTLFSVEAMNGRMVRAHSHFNYEDEILLLPGTYMEVQSQLTPATGLHIIHLKQMKPMETLLALPFQGALLYPPEKKKVPWYEKKRTIGELTLLICLCIAGIIVGSVLGTRHYHPPICYTHPPPGFQTDLLWSFDCDDAREDIKRIDNGTDEIGASYSSPDFSGQGAALYLDQTLNQYVHLPYSLNLTTNTSFTVSVWILSTGTNWATILSDCNSLNSVCIEFYVYNVNIYAQIYNWNDVTHSQSVWYNAQQVNYRSCFIHLTFTFDNQTNILSIYFDGYRRADGYLSPSDLATAKMNASVTSYIGYRPVPNYPNPFDGLIDQLSISYYVKNDSEILREATLVCHYNFETDNINFDSGPNNIPANSQNVYRSLSNSQSNLLFNSTDSYFQIVGFTLLFSKIYAYTIAFWIRPIIIKSDKLNSAIPILQFSSKIRQIPTINSYVCFLSILIANITTDSPYLQFELPELNTYYPLYQYIVKNNTWTHFTVTYSGGYQLSFYQDGVINYSLDDNRLALFLFHPRLAVTIGGSYFNNMIANQPSNSESRKCFAQNPQFNYTQMYGEIDEFQIFSRALNDSEIVTLASSKNTTT